MCLKSLLKIIKDYRLKDKILKYNLSVFIINENFSSFIIENYSLEQVYPVSSYSII